MWQKFKAVLLHMKRREGRQKKKKKAWSQRRCYHHSPNLKLERTTDLAGALAFCRQTFLEHTEPILKNLEDERETLHVGCSGQSTLPSHSKANLNKSLFNAENARVLQLCLMLSEHT